MPSRLLLASLLSAGLAAAELDGLAVQLPEGWSLRGGASPTVLVRGGARVGVASWPAASGELAPIAAAAIADIDRLVGRAQWSERVPLRIAGRAWLRLRGDLPFATQARSLRLWIGVVDGRGLLLSAEAPPLGPSAEEVERVLAGIGVQPIGLR